MGGERKINSQVQGQILLMDRSLFAQCKFEVTGRYKGFMFYPFTLIYSLINILMPGGNIRLLFYSNGGTGTQDSSEIYLDFKY